MSKTTMDVLSDLLEATQNLLWQFEDHEQYCEHDAEIIQATRDAIGRAKVEVRDPDTRLIAASPDLLAACKQVAESLGIRRDFAPFGTLGFAKDLMNAIAKAEGRSQ